MTIDWEKIATPEDLLLLENRYDEAPDYDAATPIMSGLSDEEKEDAEFWRQYARGIWLVTGDAGGGKGVFLHMIAWKFRRYFGRLAVLDTRPRESFDWNSPVPYIPFSIPMLVEQLDRMTEVATGIPRRYEDGSIPDFKPHVAADGKWISSRGQVFLRKSIIGLDEFGTRYMSRRDPMNPVQRTLLRMFPLFRHMQTTIIGCGISLMDFNKACYEKVTAHVVMTREHPVKLLFKIKFKPMKFISATGELNVASRPISMLLDAEKPREQLNGLSWKDLFVSDNAQSMDAPRSLRKISKNQ